MKLVEVDKGTFINPEMIERIEAGLFGGTDTVIHLWSGTSRVAKVHVQDFAKALNSILANETKHTYCLQEFRDLAAP